MSTKKPPTCSIVIGGGMWVAILMWILFLCCPPPAHAFDCAQVRWAVANLPKATLDSYIANATRAQIAQGRACFRHVRKHKKLITNSNGGHNGREKAHQ